ncbi:MAG: hypothetical protein IT365_23460 [Candidatus Hydrogenedentes bacterium]|nr:hypothetical protein [Candidatus Hydrogenedentota bacterium]
MSLARQLGVLRFEGAIPATYKVYLLSSNSRVCLGAEESLGCVSVPEIKFVDDPDSETSVVNENLGLSRS